MGAKSNYLENKAIDALLRGQAFPTIGSVYIALLTAAANDAGTLTEVSTSGTAYARATVAASLTNWKSTQGDNAASTGSSGQTSNTNTITVGAQATAAWGQVTHFAVMDAAVGGNELFYGALGTPKTINAGDPAPTFGPGTLVYTEDD